MLLPFLSFLSLLSAEKIISQTKNGPINTAIFACNEVIDQYIGEAKKQHKIKKMIYNKTSDLTFIVPQNSFVSYLMIAKTEQFDFGKDSKSAGKIFNCMKEGQAYNGVYRIY